jgi:Flp pilus assembly protein TadG
MRRDRKGAAAVECALITAFVFVPIILGAIEVGRAVQVQMALVNAVREGCRAYCDLTATVTLEGQTYSTGTSAYAIAVTKYALKNANIGITDANIGSVTVNATMGTPVTVSNVTLTPATVSATIPYSLVRVSPTFLGSLQNPTASITMRKP